MGDSSGGALAPVRWKLDPEDNAILQNQLKRIVADAIAAGELSGEGLDVAGAIKQSMVVVIRMVVQKAIDALLERELRELQ